MGVNTRENDSMEDLGIALPERVRISVAAVAQRAGVSRQTVYSCPWTAEIQQASEASLRRRLQDAMDANRRLSKENVRLKAEIDDLIRQVRDSSRR